MIDVAKDTKIECLVAALTGAAFMWGKACGEEGYDAKTGDFSI